MSLPALKPYPPTTGIPLPSPTPYLHLAKITTTTCCGLLLGSTIYSSISVLPSLIAAPISTHAKLSIFDGLVERGNRVLIPIVAVATGSLGWLAYYSFKVVKGSGVGSEPSGNSNASGFFAGLGKAPTDTDAGITALGGAPGTGANMNVNSGRNFLLGTVAMVSLIGLQVLIAQKNTEIQEVVRSGRRDLKGYDDDGEEGNRRIGEVLGLSWVGAGMVGLAFGVGVLEMGR